MDLMKNLAVLLIIATMALACGGGSSTSSTAPSITQPNLKTNFYVRANYSDKPFLSSGSLVSSEVISAGVSQSKTQSKLLKSQEVITLHRQSESLALTHYGDGLYGAELKMGKNEYYALEAKQDGQAAKGYFQFKGDLSPSNPILLNSNTTSKAQIIDFKFKSNASMSATQVLHKLTLDKGDFFKAVDGAESPKPINMTLQLRGNGGYSFVDEYGVLSATGPGVSITRYWTKSDITITGSGPLDIKFATSDNVDVKSFVAKRNNQVLSSGTIRDIKNIPMNSIFVDNNPEAWPNPPTYTLEIDYDTSGASAGEGGLEYSYLNKLRELAGMTKLTRHATLEDSAFNHATYLITNKPTGKIASEYHDESQYKYGFTGVTPSDRASWLKYQGVVLENIAFETTFEKSIEVLFSAIYHRFGFLDFSISEVGISRDNQLPLNAGKYMESADVFNMGISGNIAGTMASHPKTVVWPPDKSEGISPVFYEEVPDPLPDYSVSGYPISICFNGANVTRVTGVEFEVKDVSGNMIKNTMDTTGNTILNEKFRIIDKASDPNKILTPLQFAFFPLERLAWGEKYDVSVSANVDGDQNFKKSWSFTTTKGPENLLTVTSANNSLELSSGKSYALYFPPSHGNDIISNASFNSVDGIKTQLAFYDKNTLSVSINGNVGQQSILTVNDRKINLVSKE